MDRADSTSPNSNAPSLGGLFTLPIRTSKRFRSMSSSEIESASRKRVCENQNIPPNDHDLSFWFASDETPLCHNWEATPVESGDEIKYFSLHYPAMLHQFSKRRGLPIHKQYIHPRIFAQHLNSKHPEIDFTVAQYHKAWHYAVDLAIKNLDLSHGHQRGVENALEGGVRAAHILIERVRLKARTEYTFSKRAASAF